MRALVLGATLLIASGCAPARAVDAAPPAEAPVPTALFAVYDQAGFPTITGRKLVERSIVFDRGQPLCERGVLLEHRGLPVLLSVDLQTHYGAAPFEAIPAELRQATEREPLFEVRQARARSFGPARVERVVDSELPVLVLDRPRLGIHDPRSSPCRTDEPTRKNDGPIAELDVLVRARWAHMRGLPELALELLGELAVDDPNLEARLRSTLARVLVEEAERGMIGWLPRDEVAHLLRRAAVIDPGNPRAGRWMEDARRLSLPTPPLRSGTDPDTLATLLAEQPMQPGSLPSVPFVTRLMLTWNVDEHLRDPMAELLRLGMPGVRRLVDRVGDRTWTRAACKGGPCRLGALVRDGLGHFAMRRFATDADVLAWWSTVEHTTETEMLRAALHGPTFPAAASRLTRLVGPGILDELEAFRGKRARAEIEAAICDAAFAHEAAITADPALRRRYSRVLRELVDAAGPGWPPDAFASWLAIDPTPALDLLVARFGEQMLRMRDDEVDVDIEAEFYWSAAFEIAMKVEHRAMMRLFARALQLPQTHAAVWDAWDALDVACGTAPQAAPEDISEPYCPRSVRRAAIRLLRRDLAAMQSASLWSGEDAWRLAVLTGKPTKWFADVVPLREQFRRGQVLLGRRAPALPDVDGDSDSVIATHARRGARTRPIARWLAAQRGRILRDLPRVIEEFSAVAQTQPRASWTLLITRYAGRGIVLELGAVPSDDDSSFVHVWYRDGVHATNLGMSTAEEAMEHLFRRARPLRWQTLDPPPISELTVEFTAGR